MRFFSTAVSVALAAFAAVTSAQVSTKGNAITSPSVGDTIVAGETFDITWMNIVGSEVTLTLMSGPADDLQPVGVIVASIDNTGSYTWTVPEDIPASDSYAIQISYDNNPNNFNYSDRFAFDSEVTATTTVSTARSTSAATTSAPSTTETETTVTTETTTSTDTESSTTVASTTTETGTSTSLRTSTTSRRTSTSQTSEPTSTGAPPSAAHSNLSSPLAVIMAVLAAALFLH